MTVFELTAKGQKRELLFRHQGGRICLAAQYDFILVKHPGGLARAITGNTGALSSRPTN